MSEQEETLRDKLAMSCPFDAIPVLKNKAAIEAVAKIYGLVWSDTDAEVQFKFSADFAAIFRYQYADAMLRAREKKSS